MTKRIAGFLTASALVLCLLAAAPAVAAPDRSADGPSTAATAWDAVTGLFDPILAALGLGPAGDFSPRGTVGPAPRAAVDEESPMLDPDGFTAEGGPDWDPNGPPDEIGSLLDPDG